MPWEIGLAETQQTLLLNDLRSRITVQTDGQLKTGRDVVIAALLGADEMGFSTGPLIATGCIMMRACHLNTCPVGIATQDPELRKRFKGVPEHVVNFFHFVAEEARGIMASLGVRTVDELIGRTDLLEMDDAIEHWKARGIDLTALLHPSPSARRRAAPPHPAAAARCSTTTSTGSCSTQARADDRRLGRTGRDRARDAQRQPLRRRHPLVGDRRRARRRGPARGLDQRRARAARPGQSFGGWLAPGVTFTLHGDANDYTGKGLSGGVLAVMPPDGATYRAEDNVIIGNTVLYGATSGKAFFRGQAGERFAVRNSGVHAVVEGVGDHGCEYMTGGRVVVLGPTGRNFAAGMSGGLAFVLDEDGALPLARERRRCSTSSRSSTDADAAEVLRADHRAPRPHRVAGRPSASSTTGIATARAFVKVFPTDYKRVLAEQAAEARVVARRCRPDGRARRLPQDRARQRRLPRRAASARSDLREFLVPKTVPELQQQGARCMECGVPFCHNGCPLGNLIPDWNDLVYRDRWQDAIRQLHATNNFPEFTGRLCPAPCEASCVLEINEGDAVTIKQIENSIIDRAWAEGWVKPQPPDGRDRHERRRRRRRPGRHGRRAAAAPRGPRGRAVRARRGRRRARALRRAGVQDREGDRRAPRRSSSSPRGSRSATASTSGAT